MFVIEREREFWWPVKVEVPVDNRHVTRQFRLRLKLLSRPAFADWLERMKQASAEADYAALLLEIVVDWSDLVDEQKQPVPFGEKAMIALLEIPYIPAAVVNAIREAFTPAALEKRRLGN